MRRLKLMRWAMVQYSVAPSAAGSAVHSEQELIRATIFSYFQGQATGDATHFREVFLPTAHIEGVWEGKFTSWTLDAFCALYNGKPAPDESGRERIIDVIDVSGTAAMAKATLRHGAVTFTDYFVLLRVDGAWKIANKVFHGEAQK